MANIQEKIVAFLPEVVFEEGQYPTFTVPAEKLPALARYLRDEDELQFDNLAALVGVDWGETLGVVYYLNSVKYNHWVILKAVAADRKVLVFVIEYFLLLKLLYKQILRLYRAFLIFVLL